MDDLYIPKKKKSLSFLLVAFISVFTFVIITFASIIYTFVFAAPFNFVAGTTVQIESGQSLTSIANELRDRGVVKSSIVLRSAIILLGGEHKISAGMYEFNKPQNVIRIARRVVNGDYGYIPTKVTIPEGTNVFKIADVIHEKFPDIDRDSFLVSIQGKEGYLFPNTYFFPPKASSEMIITMMGSIFKKQLKPYEQEIASSSHSMKDIIIMASILEGEVQTEQDRKMVADLLWRRIEIGMPLQVDSTFTYVNGKTSAQLTLNDLKVNSPYNTYTNKGLPPTPISNPGIQSIEAALRPIPNDYLFFLSDKDGITHFAKTHDEHVRLKNKYLK
ncbi:MAG: hypothetical protein RL094_536 [Candidatus Parcubacteria bacterium]|jgi:UPF0755 protein